ncbi:COR domain-containing protein [Pseudoalteromonas sp. 68 DY56-GL68]|uniref:COR domain-containing protein n=1 Tax=Pseudoalteromonas sp. 68 DY56-GL68 TaxID=2974919 RepID=UPI00352A12E2
MDNEELEMLENLGEFKTLVEGCEFTRDKRFIHIDYRDHKEYYTLDSSGRINGLVYSRRKVSEIDWNLISRCSTIKSFCLRDCNLTSMPDELSLMPGLVYLSLPYNDISSIDFDFSIFKEMEGLDFTSNNLSSLPESIIHLKRLEDLTINENNFDTIPTSIFKLKSLVLLSMSFNNLMDINAEISNLSNLFFLNFNDNKIESLPDEIGALSNLNFLLIENNKIKSIPNNMSMLDESLDILGLVNNPLPIPDDSFHELTPKEQIQTLISIQKSKLKALKEAKILVVGDERVGKTSIINRLLGNLHNENEASTQGIDISKLNFNGYEAHIWDFAGQELTHQTHQFFLTERSLYLYVVDAQKEDNQARDIHWFNTIKSYSKNSPIIVVVNHSDKNVNYQFDIQRYHDDFEIVDVIKTSACNLNSLPEQIRYNLGDSISTLHASIERQLPNLPGINKKLPENWHEVKNAMSKYKETQNVIDKSVFENLCNKEKVLGAPLQSALLKILNSIGTVIAYPNDFRLKLNQILKPEWVTNAVYKIVRTPSETPGLYSEEKISDILKDGYSHAHQQWLIDLLIKFELGFRLAETSDLLIPMRLPSVMPEFDRRQYNQGLNLRFNYHRIGLLKQNVLPQLIVRMHTYVDENTSKYWRHGLFLKHEDCLGVVIADEPNQSIEVFLSERNENARVLLQWVRSNLEKIEHAQIKSKENEALPYLEEVAIFDDDCEVTTGYVSYQKLIRANKRGKETVDVEIECTETGEILDIEASVSKLLGLYNKKVNNFTISEVTAVISKILLRLTDFKSKILNETEDEISDRLRESLIATGYYVKDQSRGGLSGSGRGVGERDLILTNEYGQQGALIEALTLTSLVKKTLVSHYKKLIHNYNTQGNAFDFLITYAKVKNFGYFWNKYMTNFTNFDDVSDDFTNKHALKVGHSHIDVEGIDEKRIIVHIVINFGIAHGDE